MHAGAPVPQLSSRCSCSHSLQCLRSTQPRHSHMAGRADTPGQCHRMMLHKRKGCKLRRSEVCGLFPSAFLGTMEKRNGGLSVPIKLWSQNFTPGFIAIWSLKTCRSNDLFERSEVCTTSENPVLHRTYLGNVDLVHARRDF